MHRLGSIRRTTSGRAGSRGALVAVAGAAAALTAITVLSGCTSASGAPDSGGQQPTAPNSASPVANQSGGDTSSAAPAPLRVRIEPGRGAKHVNPATPIDVKVANGTLLSVTMTNSQGKHVTGALAGNGASWQNTEALGYDKTYRLVAKIRDAQGNRETRRTHFTTVTPDNQTMPYFDDIYGDALVRGGTYGVGMVAVVHFDEAIPNRKAAEKVMTVTTTPHVDGAWYWTDDQTAHWRPRHFYSPGTKVKLTVKDYGHNFGGGLYGQSDKTISFRIGAKHYSVANAQTHRVKVYFNNKLVRNMPTSMGEGGVVQGTNGPVYLWTMPGIYTVIHHENPAIMSSASYGLSADSPYGYGPEPIYWSTKISTDGIYLHELDTTVWAQGHENVSHGCLNLNHDNAKWFYLHSRVGDVVKVVHSGGPKIQVWQGGDWSVPWKKWVAGGDV